MKLSLLLLGLLMSGSLFAGAGQVAAVDDRELPPPARQESDAKDVPARQFMAMQGKKERVRKSMDPLLEIQMNQEQMMKKLDRIVQYNSKELQRLRRENQMLRAENRALRKALVRSEGECPMDCDFCNSFDKPQPFSRMSGNSTPGRGQQRMKMPQLLQMKPGIFAPGKGRQGEDLPGKVEVLKQRLRDRAERAGQADAPKRNQRRERVAPEPENAEKNNPAATPVPPEPEPNENASVAVPVE